MTPKQALLLEFIEKFLAEHNGVSPSYDEMKAAIGLKSKSGIHKLVCSLIERGYLESIPNKARALRVLKSVEKKKNDLRLNENWFSEICHDVREIPMYGKIAAGVPILAVNDSPETISVFGLPSTGFGDFYALTVSGESMIEAGIFDGDTVVVESCQDVSPREIAVVLVDGEEVTLKYIKKMGSTIALVPANKDFQVRVLDAGRVKIQGKLVQLIRNY